MDRLITYAITVCNEHHELESLLSQLWGFLEANDDWQILVQNDDGNTTPEVYEVIEKYKKIIPTTHFSHVEYPLDMDFARYKNNLARFARGKWIFQIDADELLRPALLTDLPSILNDPDNEDLDVILLSRINVVRGITDAHIHAWRWNVRNDIPGVDAPVINWPDFQWRIYRNKPEIQWKNKVHEVLTGFKVYTKIAYPQWSLYHEKDIERQQAQNLFYGEISEKNLNL